MMHMNIIGAGNVGKTLGKLFFTRELVHIAGIINQSPDSTSQAIRFIGSGQAYTAIKDMPAADITLITTADDSIARICLELCKTDIKPGSIVMHCSGTLSSDVLIALKARGALIASVHPLRSFADPERSFEQYAGTYCAMEGDEGALRVIKPLFTAIGSMVFMVNKEKKAVYHTAGVYACNYLVTLAEQATRCLEEAGLDNSLATDIMLSLMQGTLFNLQQSRSPEKSLTGPIQRGDIATIQAHLAMITEQNQRALYAALGKATVELSAHDIQTKQNIAQTLQGL